MARTAIFFDMLGTLVDKASDDEAHYHIARRVIDMYSLEEDPSKLWSEIRGIVDDLTRDRHIVFVPFKEAYKTAFSKVLMSRGIYPTKEDRERLWKLFVDMHARHLRLMPMAKELLDFARKRFEHVGLISDSSPDEVNAVLTSLGISHNFDSITTSEEVGVGKPNPMVYRRALEKAGFPPYAFYVGDDPFRDLLGAKEAGMTVILVGKAEVSGLRPDGMVENLYSLIEVLRRIGVP